MESYRCCHYCYVSSPSSTPELPQAPSPLPRYTVEQTGPHTLLGLWGTPICRGTSLRTQRGHWRAGGNFGAGLSYIGHLRWEIHWVTSKDRSSSDHSEPDNPC